MATTDHMPTSDASDGLCRRELMHDTIIPPCALAVCEKCTVSCDWHGVRSELGVERLGPVRSMYSTPPQAVRLYEKASVSRGYAPSTKVPAPRATPLYERLV